MDWRTEAVQGALVGQPRGRIDESNWDSFSAALTAGVGEAQTRGLPFVVDLSGVDYMSSRGLRSLSLALTTAKAAAVPMSLAAPGDAMRQILAISRYDKLFRVFDSPIDAAAAPH